MPTFTREVIEKLTAKRATRVDKLHFDDGSPGFFLRTYKTGAPPVFGVKYQAGNKPRRMNLGVATPDTLKPMRELAETVRAKAKLGQDTLGERIEARKKPRSVTLGKLVPTYLKQRGGEVRRRSHYIFSLYLNKNWKALHGLALDAITRKDIVPLIDEMAEKRGRVTADRARAVLSTFFMWAIDKGYIDNNPTIHIKARSPSGGRERVLSEDELVAVWKAAGDSDDCGRVVRLLILTGCRKQEMAGLMWPEIDFERRQVSLPSERVKNGFAFILPLSDQALEILRACPAIAGQARLFGSVSWSRYKKDELDKRLPADMPHWTLHDLRRSFVTHMAENGFAPPHIVEACVNHQSGHKGAIAGIYNRATYANEKRQAFDVWGRYVSDLAAGRRRKVVPLRKGAA